MKLHADYGGVVPELASRDHVRKTVPLIRAALKEAGLTTKEIDAVAYTAGPVFSWRVAGWRNRGTFAGVRPGRTSNSCAPWKGICWRQCWKIIRLLFRSSRCWFLAVTQLISVTGIGQV